MDHWFVTGTLGGVQGKIADHQMDHAHITESVMVRTAGYELEPADPKSKESAAKEPASSHAIDPPRW